MNNYTTKPRKTKATKRERLVKPLDDLEFNVRDGHTRGWTFTPLKGKVPQLSGWQTRKRASLPNVLDWILRGANVGIRTGAPSGGIVVIDVDEGGSIEDMKLPRTVTARTGGGGRHYYFRCNRRLKNSTGKLGDRIDVKADGGQAVFPGSIHPETGERYEWVPGLAPWEVEIAKLPARIANKLNDARTRGSRAPSQEPISEGERNSTLCSLAGTMRAKGFSPEAIEVALLRENEERCSPPLDDDEVRKIAESVGKYPAGDDRKKFPPTDTGLAERFALQHGANVRYCYPWGKWLVWDGTRWKIDDSGAVEQLAKQTVRELILEAMAEEDIGRRKVLLKFAGSSESVARREAMLKLARSEPPISIIPDALDTNVWLLNCPNGTIDLRTGELREARREDYITKLCPTEYDPEAACPTWSEFLRSILPDAALRKFLRRAMGMSLAGEIREHVLFIPYGTGSNGKSTALNVVCKLLGRDYAMNAAPELLMVKKGETHPTERADLAGKRMVVSIEVSEGRMLAESLVKELTGGDPIRARRMREDFWEFNPSHTIWLATNHKPNVRGTDWAIWRRIKLIPFTVRIADDDQDLELPGKLLAEAPGILAWAVRGCLAWQRSGLGAPDVVIAANMEYRAEEDLLGTFIAECCVVSEREKTTAAALYDAYKNWTENTGEYRHTYPQTSKWRVPRTQVLSRTPV